VHGNSETKLIKANLAAYTTFEYSALQLYKTSGQISAYATGAEAEGGRTSLFETLVTVKIDVTNTGQMTGKEVVQLYLGFPAGAEEPEKVLRGFQKVLLEPGERKTVTFQLQRRDLSVWDTARQNWKLLNGKYSIYASKSSRQTVLTETIEFSLSGSE
jgi:beta-glucosidase